MVERRIGVLVVNVASQFSGLLAVFVNVTLTEEGVGTTGSTSGICPDTGGLEEKNFNALKKNDTEIKINTSLRIVNILLIFAIALFLCVSKRSERGMGRAFHCFFITGRRFISTSFKSLA